MFNIMSWGCFYGPLVLAEGERWYYQYSGEIYHDSMVYTETESRRSSTILHRNKATISTQK